MKSSFEPEDAIKYGINAAIILYNIRYCISGNIQNESNIHDGTVWECSSVKELKFFFDYLSEKQIRRALKALEEKGGLITGNYSKNKYDRSKWYALTQDSEEKLEPEVHKKLLEIKLLHRNLK